MNKAEVYFALKGEDFDPDSFTAASGLIPTKSWKKGEKGKYVEHYRFGYWQIGEEAVENETLLVDEIADKLIRRIEEKKEVIREFVDMQGLNSVLEVVLHISMNEKISTPALGFNTSTIQFLNFVKAEIDGSRSDTPSPRAWCHSIVVAEPPFEQPRAPLESISLIPRHAVESL